MDLAGIYHKANILIAQTYGITGVPEKGYVIVTVNNCLLYTSPSPRDCS